MRNLITHPAGPTVRVGFHSGQQYGHVGEVADIWHRVESLGYEWISAFDHWRPEIGGSSGHCLDATVTIATAGAATTKATVALMVVPAHLHHPGPLAMRAVALGQSLDGRFVLGLGAGGHDLGFARFGIARPPPAERVAALDEFLPLVRMLIRGEAVTSTGRYELRNASVAPAEPEGITLAVGASGPRMLAVAGRHADIWNTLATRPSRYRDQIARVRRAAAAADRDPDTIRPSLTFRAVIGNDVQIAARRAMILRQQGPAAPDLAEHVSWGNTAECVEALRPYREAGCRDFVLAMRPPLDWRTIELFSTVVAPVLRGEF